MVSLMLITVGFLLATGAVMTLARASTARWERNRRAAAAVRADEATRRTPAAGSAARRLSAMERTGLAAARARVLRYSPGTVLARLAPKAVQRGMSRVRPRRPLAGLFRSSPSGGALRGGRGTESRSPALPVDGAGADPALAPEAPRPATDVRGDGVGKGTVRQLLRRTVRHGRRPALAILHRHDEAPDVQIPQEDGDESPAAR